MVAFIVNPVAGKGRTKKVLDLLSGMCPQDPRYQVLVTRGPGDGVTKAREAVARGASRVVSVGGDGTLHEVVNGIYGTGIELGLVPSGTGNDFARSFGISLDPVTAISVAANASGVPVDLGRVNDQVFMNVAGVGFDAEVTNHANHRPMLINGTITYMASVFAMLAKYRCVDAVIETDGKVMETKILLMAVANGRYYGGGMKIAPDAAIDDGLLDIVLAKDVTKVETLMLLPKVYSGKHVHHKKAMVLRGKRVSIDTKQRLYVHADGDIIGTTPATFEVIEGAIKVAR